MLNLVNSEIVTVRVNREASEFITDNYEELVKKVKYGMRVGELAGDLVNACYLKVRADEEAGLGFDESMEVNVEEFVYGKLKGYSKNAEYNSGICQKLADNVYLICADSDCEVENMNNMQKALYNASGDYIVAERADKFQLEEDIHYCIYKGLHMGIDMCSLFENLENVDYTKVNREILSTLRHELDKDEYFNDVFISCLNVREDDRALFMNVLDRVK